MKIFASLLSFVIMTANGLSHELGDGEGPVRSEPTGPIHRFTIPFSDRAKEALEILVEHHDCTTEEFFQMSGLNIPRGGSFALDLDGPNIVADLDRGNAEFVVMLIGDMVLFCSRLKSKTAPTRKQVLDRYGWTGHKWPEWFPNPPSPEPLGEQGGARRPATAPDSKPEGEGKLKPESEGRSR